MESTFNFTTVEQQLAKLTSQHLVIEDKEMAKSVLNTYGYYSIVNGYRDPYIIREYDQKYYRPSTTFDKLYDLYSFDHTIRDQIFLSMIDLEEHLKAVTAEIIAESFGVDYNKYLSRNNYRDKRVSDPKFNRNSILESMQSVASTSNKQPIKYYRESHGIVPPWILFKGIYFGTFVNFTRFLKGRERDMLVKRLYGNKVTDENIDLFKDLLSDTLFLCLEYRNLAAHGGRVYNYIPRSSIRFNSKQSIPQKGLPTLLYTLEFFDYKQPYRRLHERIQYSVNWFGNKYIDDIPLLSSATGFELVRNQVALINPKTKKYHASQYCSNSKNLQKVNLDDALAQDYTPCKKCCK